MSGAQSGLRSAREAQALRFLDERPAGTAGLRITRFRRATAGYVAGVVVDELIGGEGESPKAPPGLTLSFVDGEGRDIVSHTVHPAAPGAEGRLLPRCVAVIRELGVPLQLMMPDKRHRGVVTLIESHDGRAPLGGGVAEGAGYRAGPEPAPNDALGVIAASGLTVDGDPTTALRIHAEETKPKNLFWLLMLPLIVFLLPLVLFRQLTLGDVARSVQNLLRRAFSGERRSLVWTLEPAADALVVTRQTLEGTDETRVTLHDVGLVSFAPGGVEITSENLGVLRVVDSSATHTLATRLSAPGQRTAEVVAAQRDVGRAFKELVEWAARRARV